MKQTHQTLLAGLAMLAATPLHADEWKHELAPYLWGSAMEGTTGIGGVTADVDASFGDILDNLEMFLEAWERSKSDIALADGEPWVAIA